MRKAGACPLSANAWASGEAIGRTLMIESSAGIPVRIGSSAAISSDSVRRRRLLDLDFRAMVRSPFSWEAATSDYGIARLWRLEKLRFWGAELFEEHLRFR